MASNIAVQQEALTRAVSSQALSNYPAIISGFMRKGIAESEIKPRENVFTYNAWRALGRQVRKGEHGVKCLTFIVQRDKRTGREEKRPWTTTVFHVSQTEKVGAIACNEALDATPENVPFAGEDEASRESGLDDAIAAHIQAPLLSIEELHTELATSGARFEHVKASEVDWLLQEPAKPEPKDSAYDRAMRGETVSIMDIIDEMKDEPKPVRVPTIREYKQRIQSSQVFQTKTVDF